MEQPLSQGVILSGSSHREFSRALAQRARIPLGNVTIDRFPDRETHVTIHEDVQGKVVFFVQSLAEQPNEYLVELLLLLDAAKRAGAKTCVAVVPYFGYARQDRIDRSGAPIAARLIADLLQTAGCEALITVDLHADQIEGFFSVPVDNIRAIPLLAEEIALQSTDSHWVVVAPDIGSIKIARGLAAHLHTEFVVVNKHRTSPTHVERGAIIGDVAEKNVLLADDMCSTAETLVSAAKACREKGAAHICAAVTHGLFTKDAMQHLEESPIETLWVTDTIPWRERYPENALCRSVSMLPLLSQAVQRHLFVEGHVTV